jgi:hypothetical protein
MKYRFSFVLLIAAGLMLWGCSSETQNPVSSNVASAEGNLPTLHKTTPTDAPPTNVIATVNGDTVTISWNLATGALSYIVNVQANGNSYVNTTVLGQQLVLTGVPSGTDTVWVVGNFLDGQGPSSALISFTISSVVAPTVTVKATPIPLCARNGEWVTVTFSGTVVNTAGGASYQLKDEYNIIHYSGTVPAGPYSIKLALKDRSIWFDKDGRQYTFIIITTNSAGSAKASVTVTVPTDRRFTDWNDHDGWDDHR